MKRYVYNFIYRVLALAFAILLAFNLVASAQEYSDIIAIGADLNADQRAQVLNELGDSPNVDVIEVTNSEEYHYLGGIIPDSKIGSQALSSARIIFQEKGVGLYIDVSDNINYITPDIYRNALTTAGITDATVMVTAPMSVTGTGALTGIMKAYEIATGQTIDEDVKQVANEELIVTAEISEEVGAANTTDLMNTIKVQLEENMPENEDQMRVLIVNIASNNGINLSDQQVDRLVDLFMNMKEADIDWNGVVDNISKRGEQVSEFLSSEQGQGFLQSLKDFLNSLIDSIMNFFS